MWSFPLIFNRCFIILAWLGIYAGELVKTIASLVCWSQTILLSLWFLPLSRCLVYLSPSWKNLYFLNSSKYFGIHTVIIISIEALNCFDCLLVVMAGYGVVLNFATDTIAYEFARTIYSISTSSTSSFKI